MTAELLIRSLMLLIICGCVAYRAYFEEDRESGTGETDGKAPRYTNHLPVYVLPAFILIVEILSVVYYGWEESARFLLSWSFGTFSHLSVYYLVLLLVIPVFRRYFTARSCAQLWMLPTLLYTAEHAFMSLPEPLMVVRLPETVVRLGFYVWLTGFILFFLWQLLVHLRFRRRILSRAVPVRDTQVLALWQQARAYCSMTRNNRLVFSPAVSTPLSVGLFRRTTVVVLPERNYEPWELELIFRHELIHIGREDSGTKFFLLFCTAACWFNPLMWIAMKKSAEDLELSCDETVLLGTDDQTRQRYAALVLQTAGHAQGFTTCLSASANTMRYRLRGIVSAKRRFNGGLILGIVLFCFLMTSGYVALSYSSGSGADRIFYSGTPQSHELRSVSVYTAAGREFYSCGDEDALKTWLAGLELSEITGNYTFSGEGPEMTVILLGPEGAFGVTVDSNSVLVNPLYDGAPRQRQYYLPSEPDWEALFFLLTPEAA